MFPGKVYWHLQLALLPVCGLQVRHSRGRLYLGISIVSLASMETRTFSYGFMVAIVALPDGRYPGDAIPNNVAIIHLPHVRNMSSFIHSTSYCRLQLG